MLLKRVTKQLNKLKNKRFRIERHTDNTVLGEEETREKYNSNMGLSLARAKTVANLLQKYGVDKKSISTVDYGRKKQPTDNSTPAKRALNRRVAIIITDK